jgi:hypothetical protein
VELLPIFADDGQSQQGISVAGSIHAHNHPRDQFLVRVCTWEIALLGMAMNSPVALRSWVRRRFRCSTTPVDPAAVITSPMAN